MKIINVIPTLESGGAERMLSNLVNFSEENEYIIITLFKSDIFYKINLKVKIIELNINNNLKGKIAIFFKLAKVVKEIKPDIVNFWMKTSIYSPIKYFVKFRYKTIFNYRNSFNAEKKNSQILTKLISNIADGNIFVSDESYETRYKNGFTINDYKIIGNGFIQHSYSYEMPQKLTLGYLGRYHPVKNQAFLLEALNKIENKKNIEILLAGKNLSEDKFNNIDPELNIKWLGEIEDVEKFYNKISFLVLTSKHEGFPNVIGEAMSRGIPVITTNAGESFKIVGDTGFKVKNEQELVEILNNLINYPDQLLIKSKKSYQKIKENYEMNIIIQKYNEYFKRIGELQ